VTDFDPRTKKSSLGRRFGLVLAGVLLLSLLASFGVHMSGRWRFAQAAEQFVSELPGSRLELSTSALATLVVSLAPPVPDPSDNAARWLTAGGKAMVLNADEDTQLRSGLASASTASWSAPQEAKARDMVQRNRGGLDTMQRAVACVGSSFEIDYSDLVDAEIPNLLELLIAGFLVNLDARLAFADGDPAAGFAALNVLARLTDSLRREPPLIFSLIAHVTEKLLLQGITEVLTSEQPWATQPQRVEQLRQLLPHDDLLAVSRKIVALDAAVTSLAKLQGWAELPLVESEPRWHTFFYGHRRAAAALDVGRQAVALVDQPYALHPERFSTHGNRASASHNLESAYRRSITKSQLAMSQRQLVLSALEVRTRGLRDGAYPTACEQSSVAAAADPYFGRGLSCELDLDGSFRLVFPGAGEVIEQDGLEKSWWILGVVLPPIAGVGLSDSR